MCVRVCGCVRACVRSMVTTSGGWLQLLPWLPSRWKTDFLLLPSVPPAEFLHGEFGVGMLTGSTSSQSRAADLESHSVSPQKQRRTQSSVTPDDSRGGGFLFPLLQPAVGDYAARLAF